MENSYRCTGALMIVLWYQWRKPENVLWLVRCCRRHLFHVNMFTDRLSWLLQFITSVICLLSGTALYTLDAGKTSWVRWTCLVLQTPSQKKWNRSWDCSYFDWMWMQVLDNSPVIHSALPDLGGSFDIACFMVLVGCSSNRAFFFLLRVETFII